ncbi:MAG TPA: hypothetical protein VNX25_03435, partial [Verrucomicrobiae bacterium]|nr:hypothetical protein [Verrucomicrobiae bacterium]
MTLRSRTAAHRKGFLFRAAAAIAFCISLAAGSESFAAARPFTERFSVNSRGDIKLIGNTIITCDPAGRTNGDVCAAGRSATGNKLDSQAFNMVYVNIDGQAISSSSADLSLPAGSSVLWAGLYWGGDTSSTQASPPYTTVKLKTPASGGYITVNAANTDIGLGGGNLATFYSCFADVTSYVRSGMSGTYTLADMQTNLKPTGTPSWFGGWGLVVVFSSTSMPLRNLVVFDGFAEIGNNSGIVIPLSGFTTPLNGPVGTTVGFMVEQGELGGTGDGMMLNSTVLQDALRPSTNFMNSTVT